MQTLGYKVFSKQLLKGGIQFVRRTLEMSAFHSSYVSNSECKAKQIYFLFPFVLLSPFKTFNYSL